MNTKRKPVATVPTWQDVPLFEREAEPKTTKADWLMANELSGPGTLDKDVFLVWRIVQQGTKRTQSAIVKYLHGQCEWDEKRAERAVNRAIGTRAITYGKGGLLVASDCAHVSRSFV